MPALPTAWTAKLPRRPSAGHQSGLRCFGCWLAASCAPSRSLSRWSASRARPCMRWKRRDWWFLEEREVFRAPEGEADAAHTQPPEWTPDQREALDTMLPALRRGEGAFLLHGRHRQRQDRGVPGHGGRDAQGGQGRDHPCAGDCPHAADGALVPRALRAGDGGFAQPPHRRPALRRMAAHPPGLCAGGGGRAQRGLCPRGEPGPDRN